MTREFKLVGGGSNQSDYMLHSRWAYMKGETLEFTPWELIYDGDDEECMRLLYEPCSSACTYTTVDQEE